MHKSALIPRSAGKRSFERRTHIKININKYMLVERERYSNRCARKDLLREEVDVKLFIPLYVCVG